MAICALVILAGCLAFRGLATCARGARGPQETRPFGDCAQVHAAGVYNIPNMVVIPGTELGYFVPICDTAFKTWQELSDEEHRDSAGDREAQMSIGELPAHNQEHLTPGDRGVVMLRRRLGEIVRDVGGPRSTRSESR